MHEESLEISSESDDEQKAYICRSPNNVIDLTKKVPIKKLSNSHHQPQSLADSRRSRRRKLIGNNRTAPHIQKLDDPQLFIERNKETVNQNQTSVLNNNTTTKKQSGNEPISII